ncbi:MAG: radical SAM protein [Candidatus Omnitrophica bacterium]|nr:radical SAM protein [Candidatus Omnitrophota bacterium]
MKKALLCVPQSDYGKKPQQPPLGLLSIAAVLEHAGYVVELFDNSIQRLASPMLHRFFRRAAPDIIGVSLHVENRFAAKKMTEVAKNALPGIPVVVGGAFATLCHREIIEDWSSVDIAARGEGEYLFGEIMQHLGDREWGAVKGVTFRRGSEVISTEDRELIADLNNLPDPAFHLLYMDEYPNYLAEIGLTEAGIIAPDEMPTYTASLMFGRGCPFKCIFCNTNALWKGKYRIISPERAVEQIQWHYSRGVNGFTFWDDDILIDRQWFFRLCDLIEERGMKIFYKCLTNVRHIDEEVAERLHRTGCRFITLGIEHGSERVLDLMNKKITRGQIESALGFLSKKRIFVQGSLMLNTPGETLEDIRDGLVYFHKLEEEYAYGASLPSVMKLYPGTDVERQLLESGAMRPIRWTEKYVERRNIFFRTSPYVPLYENTRTEELASYLISQMIDSRLGGFFLRMLFVHIVSLRKELHIKEKIRMVFYCLRGIWWSLKKGDFAQKTATVSFIVKTLCVTGAKKIVKRFAKGKKPSPEIVYVSYSNLSLEAANSIQTYLTAMELYNRNRHIEIYIPHSPGRRATRSFLPVRRIRYLSLKSLFCFFGFGEYFPNYLTFIDQVGFACGVSLVLLFEKLKKTTSSPVIYVRDVPFAAAYNVLFKKILRLPLIVEVAALERNQRYLTEFRFMRPISSRLDIWAIRKADGVVTQADSLRKYVIETFRKDPSCVRAILNSFDSRLFYPRQKAYCRRYLGLDDASFIVLYSGLSFRYRKVPDLIKALQYLDNPNIKLLFLGGDRSYEQAMRAMLKEFDVSPERAIFAGRVPLKEVPLYLNAADALIISGMIAYDTSTLKLFEYMSVARPIICGDAPVLREILGPDGALYFRLRDMKEFAGAVRALAENEELRKGLSERALRLSGNFTYKKRAEEILEFCASIKENRREGEKRHTQTRTEDDSFVSMREHHGITAEIPGGENHQRYA